VISTVKHFMGNNSEFDRHKVNEIIDERTMREIYLPVFEAAVKEAHVGAIMDSYNLTNGLHMTQNDYLNSQVVKKEWGFDGIIMSDWDATYDGVAAANAGLDLEMPSGKFMNRATLLPAVQAGTVSVATIDDKIRRILRKAIQFGFLDHDQTDRSVSLYNLEGRQVALEAARSSMVLLKNDGNMLPLEKSKSKSILVVGPDAYPGEPVGGGSARVQPFAAVSYLEGLANYLGDGAKVFYHRGLATLNDMVQATEFSTAESGGEPGLKVEYFDNMELKGAPVAAHTDRHVNYTGNFAAGVPANSYSIRWTGYFTPPKPGEYHLIVSGVSDRVTGARLYLDGKLVMDNWDRVTLVNYVTLPLQSGPHKVVLEYFKGAGRPRISLAVVASEGIVDPEVKALASRADAVVIAAGFDPSNEAEGSDRTFRLPAGQDELIRETLAANKNVIVVITAGGNVDMTQWVDRVPALLHAWYPGQEGGTAFAQLLFGDYSPSGRLPVSFERRWEDNATHDSYYPKNAQTRDVNYSEGVFLGYRHFDRDGIKPLFPFGYGLSYTTFAYKNLVVTPGAATRPALVAFDVTNTGTRAGAEVAQLYVGDRHATVPRPTKELKGFAKVELKAGETRHVELTLDRRALSFYDVKKHGWAAEPGEFEISVGRSAGQIELTGKLRID
jgi:beta-glucosidase